MKSCCFHMVYVILFHKSCENLSISSHITNNNKYSFNVYFILNPLIMDFVEIAPFLFVLSERNYKGDYTEITLDDYESKLSSPTENISIKSIVDSILGEFPHKSFIPASYILRNPLLRSEDPCRILFHLLEFSNLQPMSNKGRLCFSFKNKQKVAKLSDIIEENSQSIFGEVIKLAIDTQKINIGEDLIVNINGVEKVYKNTSENYLKAFSDKSKENKRPKKKTEFKPSTIFPALRALRDISNSGN